MIKLTESDTIKFMRLGKDALLQIFDAFPEDSGEYVCIAKNKFGIAKSYFSLCISGSYFEYYCHIQCEYKNL